MGIEVVADISIFLYLYISIFLYIYNWGHDTCSEYELRNVNFRTKEKKRKDRKITNLHELLSDTCMIYHLCLMKEDLFFIFLRF